MFPEVMYTSSIDKNGEIISMNDERLQTISNCIHQRKNSPSSFNKLKLGKSENALELHSQPTF